MNKLIIKTRDGKTITAMSIQFPMFNDKIKASYARYDYLDPESNILVFGSVKIDNIKEILPTDEKQFTKEEIVNNRKFQEIIDACIPGSIKFEKHFIFPLDVRCPKYKDPIIIDADDVLNISSEDDADLNLYNKMSQINNTSIISETLNERYIDFYKLKLTKDQIAEIEAIERVSYEHYNSQWLFDRSKYLLQHYGYFNLENKIQIDYLPSSSELQAINNIISQLGWEK